MGQDYTIQESTRLIFYVYRESHREAKREVDVEKLTCLCTYREQTQMPCKHLVRALGHVDTLHRIAECFNEMYKFENYKRAVEAVSYRLPLYADRKPEGSILPPKDVARAGRTQYFQPDVPRTYDHIRVCNLIHASHDDKAMLNDETDYGDVDEDGFELGGTGLESILALLNE
ncbi:hypothetical protein SDRG_03625 [Saprolegnia diclina VS20]|uniref:SWIM-type domain-containing protein n=1 Tax=Saprolegnia diclina (strain VS20) TaxID=1156394 RepID=T0S9K7_SAPDV|nr:hypothetical protein SDRG_03625 [Saprolegnia diclina VS20]EQC39422.1 hypothetical protein SDRG_03625 [Saprolegnia diclina VS20]|eukprot:XP_008607483.1 hypothetical protein SDRG_03625 [Saprolegnia diclina VS20]